MGSDPGSRYLGSRYLTLGRITAFRTRSGKRTQFFHIISAAWHRHHQSPPPRRPPPRRHPHRRPPHRRPPPRCPPRRRQPRRTTATPPTAASQTRSLPASRACRATSARPPALSHPTHAQLTGLPLRPLSRAVSWICLAPPGVHSCATHHPTGPLCVLATLSVGLLRVARARAAQKAKASARTRRRASPGIPCATTSAENP